MGARRYRAATYGPWNMPTFNYTIKHQLTEPIFSHSITMSVRKGTPLIRYMEMASRLNSVEFSG